jgi:hypothetical protein
LPSRYFRCTASTRKGPCELLAVAVNFCVGIDRILQAAPIECAAA